MVVVVVVVVEGEERPAENREMGKGRVMAWRTARQWPCTGPALALSAVRCGAVFRAPLFAVSCYR